MMVECELCGRQFKNPQGLRGHKTFYHGIRANHAKKIKPDHYREAEETKINEEQLNLQNRVREMESTIVELKDTFEKWQSYMALLSTQSETQHLASKIKLIEKQVEKHDRWFNPKGLHEAVVSLNGGPIAYIEERLRGRQSFTK
jgi:hypothetical protein